MNKNIKSTFILNFIELLKKLENLLFFKKDLTYFEK
jgi:hypothetical protein